MYSGGDSRKAALLVDWENLESALNSESRRYRFSPRTVAQDLIAAIGKLAHEEFNATLFYSAAFASNMTLGRVSEGLQKGGLSVLPTRVAKNAADTRLIVEAMRKRLKEQFTVFFVVSGDVDYIELLNELRAEAADAMLLPLDRFNLKPDVQAWEPKQFLVNLIPFEKRPPATADDLQTFAILCQMLTALKGKLNFGSTTQDADICAAFPEDGKTPAILWETAKHKHWFQAEKDLVANPPRPYYRLSYETPELLRLLWSVDIVLGEVADAMARGRPCGALEAMNSISDPSLLDTLETQDELFESLKRAGVIAVNNDQISLIKSGAEHGYLRPFYRTILIALRYGGAQDGIVKKHLLSRGWREYFPKDRPEFILKTYEEEGGRFVDAAQRQGILLWDKAERGFRLRTAHPLVDQTVKLATRSLELCRRAIGDGKTTPFDDYRKSLDEVKSNFPVLLSSEASRYIWLSELAGTKHIHAYRSEDGVRVVQLGKNSRFVSELLAKDSP